MSVSSLSYKGGQNDLAERLERLADELVDPMVCREPAYGAPGRAHCAACCYGTLLVITCEEDQACADAAKAMHRAASIGNYPLEGCRLVPPWQGVPESTPIAAPREAAGNTQTPGGDDPPGSPAPALRDAL